LRASPPITNSFIFGTAAAKIAPITVFTIFFKMPQKNFPHDNGLLYAFIAGGYYRAKVVNPEHILTRFFALGS